MPRPSPSPPDALEDAFRLLTGGPSPLALDGREVGRGLPARPIPLGELRSMLLHPSYRAANPATPPTLTRGVTGLLEALDGFDPAPGRI